MLLSTLMVSVDEPEPPEMLVVLNELVGPVGDDVADSVTAPENPLSGAILMVVEPDPPAWIEREVGLAVIVKFGVEDVIAKDMVCERSPLVPVTVTVNVPLALVRHDRVEVPGLVRLEDVRLHVIPADGEADSESDTVPVKLFRKLTVMVEVADAPVATEAVVGLAVTEKSSIVMVTVAVRALDPLVPVTVTV